MAEKKEQEKKEQEKKEKKKRENLTIEIGPLLKKLLDDQKENIKKATYECVKPSYYEAGEIIAKKIMKKGGIRLIGKERV